MPAGTKARSATTTPEAIAGRAATRPNTTAMISRVTDSMSQSAWSDSPKKVAKFEAAAAARVRAKADVCMMAFNRSRAAAIARSQRGKSSVHRGSKYKLISSSLTWPPCRHISSKPRAAASNKVCASTKTIFG